VSSKEEEERRLGLCVSNVGNFSGSAPDSLLCVARLLCGVGEGCKIKINRAGVSESQAKGGRGGTQGGRKRGRRGKVVGVGIRRGGDGRRRVGKWWWW
jgi:hypothetical protein